MNILHVIPTFNKAAGTSLFCGELANQLVSKGHEVTIAVGVIDPTNVYQVSHRVKVVRLKDLQWWHGESIVYDIVHIHALWLPSLHKIYIYARKHRVPIVWSTHGATAPWAMHYKWWKKLPAWLLYQKHDILGADVVHATSELEQEWNSRLGMQRQILAPVGAHMPLPFIGGNSDVPFLRVLFVGRICPVKGLQHLINASVTLSPNDIHFTIVGPDQDEYKAKLIALAHALGVEEMFDWAGTKYGADLSREYDLCDVFILPSDSENFGGVIVDALSHAKPVVASRFTPWQELETYKCGWWVNNAPQSLSATLKEILAISKSDLRVMGERGRKLVERKYSWSAIGSLFVETYRKLIG